MNMIELHDIAPLKYDNVMLSDDALDALSVVNVLNHKLDVNEV